MRRHLHGNSVKSSIELVKEFFNRAIADVWLDLKIFSEINFFSQYQDYQRRFRVNHCKWTFILGLYEVYAF